MRPHGWALAAGLAIGVGEAAVCEDLMVLETAGQVFACGEELLTNSSQPPELSQSLQEVLEVLKDFDGACLQGLHDQTVAGCRALHSLALEWASSALFHLWCASSQALQPCDEVERASLETQRLSWQGVKLRHQEDPIVARTLRELESGLQEAAHTDGVLPPAWRAARRAAKELYYWVTVVIWRETQWQWLQDSLAAQNVVHTTWGEPEEWLRFGPTDCHSAGLMPLPQPGPKYAMNQEPRFTGMRFQVLAALLRELRDRRGGGELVVVEVGVFVGQLSGFLLEHCSFVRLVGVDPYVGAETFPGHFEKLDPRVALAQASRLYESHGSRAALLPMGSTEAAQSLPEDSVDAVFIDGCHLYDCVKEDLGAWVPKLRQNAPVLVAGHDFSPQWPGVVRAVHEERAPDAEVTLSTDWLFWWFQ
ncbi:unnamed protein product [Effrenium voratum]|nr:unnamed protein product [Effrenium voratum]